MRYKAIFRTFLLGVCVVVLTGGLSTAQTRQVYKVQIDGTIDKGLAPYVERILQEAGEGDVVILDIDTLGGLSEAALQIRDALLETKAKTIAFINPRAISAGALISLATHHIVMTPGATIGAATPIMLIGGEASAVDEKYISYFRAEMRATAESRGRRGDIAEAMVDPEIAIEDITSDGKLLTLSTTEALEYGIADHEALTFGQVLEKYELKGLEILETEINWAESLVRFLTNPIITSLLLMLGFVGVYVEVKTPGFGIPGAVGMLCLGLFFWGHFLIRLVGWEEMLLFIAGIMLLLLELLVIPGFGIVGILGITAIITSLVLAMVGRFELLSFQDIQGAVTKLTAALIGTLIVAVVVAKFLPRTSFGQQIFLQTIQEPEDGYVAQSLERKNLLGMIGLTISPVHPSGTIMLNAKRYDVISEGEFIDKNANVKIIEVEGARIVVRQVDTLPTSV